MRLTVPQSVRVLACAARILAFAMALAPSGSLAVGFDNSALMGNEMFRTANAHVKAARWSEAIPLLHILEREFPNSPDVQNLLGVSYRKLKDYDTSKRHYDRALEIDYAHLPTLEYQGEWFIETGNMARARKNLEALKIFCGACEEYRDLAEAIARAEAGR